MSNTLITVVDPDKHHERSTSGEDNDVHLTPPNTMVINMDSDGPREQSGPEDAILDSNAIGRAIPASPAVVNIDARSGAYNGVGGNQYIYINQMDGQSRIPYPVLHNVKKDATLNKLSGNDVDGFFVTLPRFEKSLSEKSLSIQLAIEARASSCAFDLARRLGLLPGQPNEEHCEYEIISLDDLVHNGEMYCARLSRHFLVLLITMHVQEVWQVGNRMYASTDIGQFTLYEHQGRRLVHFEESIRTTTGTLIPDQVLECIQRVARGEHKDENGNWQRVRPEDFATVHQPLMRVVHYLRKSDIEEWTLLKIFANTLAGIVVSIIRDVRTPESFAIALRHGDWKVPGARDAAATACEQLAVSVRVFLAAHDNHFSGVQVLAAHDNHFSGVRDLLTGLGTFILRDVVAADQEFLGRPVDGQAYLLRSVAFFQELFRLYRVGRASELLRRELQNLISPQTENIALVIAQGGLALIAEANAMAILNMAKEVPEEWIHFVCAEDGDMFLGAAA